MKLLVILVVFLLAAFLVEKIVGKFLSVKKIDLSETPGKSIEHWGRVIIGILFVFTYLFALEKESDALLKWNLILFLTASTCLQVILEWKYLKESKQYISTLISSIIIITIFFFVVHFYY